nr:esterase [Casimicrobium sp.]
GAKQKIIQGSDHAISEFAVYVDEVAGFCTGDA